MNRNNLMKMAFSLRCLPEGGDRHVRITTNNDSDSSEDNVLEDVEKRVLARTQSQA